MPLPRTLSRRARPVVPLVASLLLAVGCGVGSPDSERGPLPTAASGPGANGIEVLPPEEALKQARAAVVAARSFRVQGSSLSGGAIDLAFVHDAGSTGIVSSGGSPVQIVAMKDRVYVKGDDAFISRNVGADAVKTLSGKWLLLPAGSSSGFSIFADGGRFAASLLDPPGGVARTKVATVDGTLAVGLVFAQTGERVWVAIRGKPLPVRFEEEGASGDTGVLRFVDYDKGVALSEPPPAQVVDAASLPTAAPAPTTTTPG